MNLSDSGLLVFLLETWFCRTIFSFVGPVEVHARLWQGIWRLYPYSDHSGVSLPYRPLTSLAIYHLVNLSQGYKVDTLETTISTALMNTAYLTRGLFHLAQVPYFAQDPNTNTDVYCITTGKVPVLAAMFPAHPHRHPRKSLTCPSPPSWQGSGPLGTHAPRACLNRWFCSLAVFGSTDYGLAARAGLPKPREGAGSPWPCPWTPRAGAGHLEETAQVHLGGRSLWNRRAREAGQRSSKAAWHDPKTDTARVNKKEA